jgi:polar amino acid transport system permease protein
MESYDFHWNVVFNAFPQLLSGAFTTFHVSVLSMLVGIIAAVFLALGKMSNSKVLYYISNVWIEVSRNTPALFIIYMAYFGLGAYGIHLSPYFSVFAALVFVNGGYLAETFRGGFQSIPPTQYNAAKSLGMNNYQAYKHILLPQMFRRIYHPMTNQFIWSILMSSLGILVGMNDLSGETQRLQSSSFRTLEFFIVAAGMYYVIAKSVLLIAHLVSKRIFKGELS